MTIRDNPSFKELQNQLKAFRIIAPLRGVIRHLGKTGRTIAEGLDEIPALSREAEEMLGIPDRFSTVLGPRGWVVNDDMKYDVMRLATELAEAGLNEQAERALIDYYCGSTIRFWLQAFLGVKAYRPRHDLMLLATTDHEEGRYHASVPLVLAQIDGLVLDLTNTSFYKRQVEKLTHVTAEDSVAGHPKALAAHAALVSQERKQTSTTMIDIPYRHGILHGRDLGYANESTSAKAFAAFLALRPLALKIESGKQFERPPIQFPDPQEMTWRDVKTTLREAWSNIEEYGRRRHSRDIK